MLDLVKRAAATACGGGRGLRCVRGEASRGDLEGLDGAHPAPQQHQASSPSPIQHQHLSINLRTLLITFRLPRESRCE